MSRPVKIKIPQLDIIIPTPGQVTLLELLRHKQVPIANSCSGEAVCGWCRVRILDGLDELDRPTADEQELIAKKKFPPGERLACQIWVESDLTIATDYW